MNGSVTHTGRGGDVSATAQGRASAAARAERIILLVVLLVVGGALGYAAIRAVATPSEHPVEAGDIAVVSKGEPVDLKAHLVKGKYTVYDFYADWCPPCRALDVRLHELAAQNDNLAIRKIDIVDWTTPVVQQHGIEGLPHMVLFDPAGKQLAEGQAVFPLLNQIFDARL